MRTTWPTPSFNRQRRASKTTWLCATFIVSLGLSACSTDDDKDDDAAPTPVALRCDDTIKSSFKPDADTSVLSVRAFAKGDTLPNPTLENLSVPGSATTALETLCLVKLLVGPGNPGSAGAPSTSAGIGIEVWLPSKETWTGRVHAIGGGGWMGSQETDPSKISGYSAAVDARSPATIAAEEASVTSSTDTGHSGGDNFVAAGGSFAMLPDGSVNTRLWEDFSERAIYQQVVKTKALASAYYGAAPKYTYWDGNSTGGRQGMKLAQKFPQELDGILVGNPVVNWTRFETAEMYPQVVIQRDLAGNYMSPAQLDLVSNTATSACDVVGGKHLGYVLDPASCRYDPTKDASVLCASSGGTNSTAACVSSAQALAINKIWYGMTSDGSVVDPAIDNGVSALTGLPRWYGLTRGTNLQGLASPVPFDIASHQIALELQNPAWAIPTFMNTTGNGQDGWKSLTYAKLSEAFDAGLAMQTQFSNINTDEPDLSTFKARGGKLIHIVGQADTHVFTGGSVNYYERVAATMGGVTAVHPFYRMFLFAGMGHAPMFSGTADPAANPPLPARRQAFSMLTDWVEKSLAPDAVVVQSKGATSSLPACFYPAKATFTSGDPLLASSYACR